MGSRIGWTLSVVATLVSTGVASAQEEVKSTTAHAMSGPQVAVSVNLGLGVGNVYKNGLSRTGQVEDLKITDAAKASLPLAVELGYRVNPRFYVGLWGSWEKVFAKTNDISCPDGFDCNNSQWRFGPEVRYHLMPGSGFDPWLGLGVGLEILKSHVKGETQIPLPTGGFAPASVDTRVTDRGPTFARLSFGGDIPVARSLALGPVITASVGSYTVRTGDQTVNITGLPAQTSAVARVDDGFHALFTIGLRGVLRAL